MTVNDDDLPDWTPATCTLPKAEQPLRVAESVAARSLTLPV